MRYFLILTVLFGILFSESLNQPVENTKHVFQLTARDIDWPNLNLQTRDLSEMLYVATTAPVSNSDMLLHADIADSILDAGEFNAAVFHGIGTDANWGMSAANLLGTPGYENTFEAIIPTPANGFFYAIVQANMVMDGETITVSQAPVNVNNSFPAPFYLSVCEEDIGDELSGNINLDIVDVQISTSDDKVYVKMTNHPNSPGFPTGGFFGPWPIYTVGFLNPEDADSTLYGLAYAESSLAGLSPGLWKLEVDSSEPVIIGNIQYTIDGNDLHMSANWSDIFNDPDFGPWPNEFEALGMAGVTVLASTSGISEGDIIDPVLYGPGYQQFEVDVNIAPVLLSFDYEVLSESGGLYEVRFDAVYQDGDNHFPMVSNLTISGTEFEMISYDHIYSDGSLFEAVVTLPGGNHVYQVSFFDGMDWDSSGEVSFTLGGSTIVPGDINGDGIVNILDVVQLVNFVLGQTEPTADQFEAGDVNNDDVLNIQDIVIIINMILETNARK